MQKFTVEAHKGDEVLATYVVRAHSKDEAQRQAGKISTAQGLHGHSVRATLVNGEPLPADPVRVPKEKFKRAAAPEPDPAPVKAESPKPAAPAAPAEKKPKSVLVKAEKKPPAAPAEKKKKEAALPAAKKKKGAG